MPVVSRETRLKRRPVGLPSADDFELAEVSLPDPRPGQVLVRNLWMSVDPYMRGRMTGLATYIAGFELGRAMQGGAIGRVVQSNGARLKAGDIVHSMQGWREAFLSDGSGLERLEPGAVPPQAYLGVMGMTGLTAHAGLTLHGRPKPGETVFVSGAAGAVGSVACQVARLKGCRVVGSAGSDAKVAWLKSEARVDAFNYKTAGRLDEALARACPGGIDVYFDNVGGPHLEAALSRMNEHGRVVMCGAIGQYNAAEPPAGPRNLFLAVTKRLTLAGFIVSDHWSLMPEFRREMGRWIEGGKVKWRETVVEGIENAPKAFLGLFSGDNLGKMLVRLRDDAPA